MRSGISFVIIVMLLCASVQAYDWSTNPGDGSAGHPYQISTPEQLMSIGSDSVLLTKHYVLSNDIVFDPDHNPTHLFESALIAADQDDNGISYEGEPFSGSLDGNGFQIVSLRFSSVQNDKTYLGLFGAIGSAGTVKNLHLQNFYIQNARVTGSLAGLNEGTVEHCAATGRILDGESGSEFGGLVGRNNGLMRNCSSATETEVSSDGYGIRVACGGLVSQNNGLIVGCSTTAQFDIPAVNINAIAIGGLAGHNTGDIRNSTATASLVTRSRTEEVGGLIGWNASQNGHIVNCHADLDLTVNGGSGVSDIGGLIGTQGRGTFYFGQWETCEGKVIDCSGTLVLHQRGDYAGGLIGFNESGDVIRCYADITAPDMVGYSYGGLIGLQTSLCSTGLVQDCYVSGSITGGEEVGGLIGGFNNTSVNHCYSTCSVSSQTWMAGGLTGYVGDGDSEIVSCYFLDTAGLDNGYGTPLDDPNMMLQANFSSWDFVGEDANGTNEIWRMCVDGLDYPRLSWEFAANGDFACGDGVDLADLEALAEHWLLVGTAHPAEFNYACDANGDEVIDMADFTVLSENWP